MAVPMRVIPCLLLWGDSVVTTTCFRHPQHIGDPVDFMRKLSKAGADELILLDITASRKRTMTRSAYHKTLDLDLIARISDECCMPVTYGGGIRTLEDIRDLLNIGVEKVLIGTHAVDDPSLIARASEVFGNHSIGVAIDTRRLPDGRYGVYTNGGMVQAGIDPASLARRMKSAGAGSIFLNSIDRDGMLCGYDLPLVRSVARAVSAQVIACGGAGSIDDFCAAIQAGASAAAASSIFVFQACRRTAHISYPARREVDSMRHDTPENAVAGGR